MNLVWFLTIATILSVSLGEFGQFPFGATLSVSLTDLLLALTIGFLLIWQVGIKRSRLWPDQFEWMIVFWVWAGLSLVFSKDLSGGVYLGRFILFSASFYLGWVLINSKVVKQTQLINWMIISGLILALAGFFQLVFFPNLTGLTDLGFDPHQGRLVSTFLDPNLLGAFLNICLGLTLWRFLDTRNRRWLLVATILVLAIIPTLSRSAYLMLLAISLILGFWQWRQLLIGLIVLIVVMSLLPQVHERLSGAIRFDVTVKARVESWQKGLTIFKAQPLTGVGFNNLRAAYERANLVKVFSQDGGHAGAGNDSSLIFLLATTGLPGLAIMTIFWGKLVTHLMSARSSGTVILLTILAGLFLDSQFINSLFYPPVMLVLFALSGAMVAGIRRVS